MSFYNLLNNNGKEGWLTTNPQNTNVQNDLSTKPTVITSTNSSILINGSIYSASISVTGPTIAAATLDTVGGTFTPGTQTIRLRTVTNIKPNSMIFTNISTESFITTQGICGADGDVFIICYNNSTTAYTFTGQDYISVLILN